jgi:hypothetical protein
MKWLIGILAAGTLAGAGAAIYFAARRAMEKGEDERRRREAELGAAKAAPAAAAVKSAPKAVKVLSAATALLGVGVQAYTAGWERGLF